MSPLGEGMFFRLPQRAKRNMSHGASIALMKWLSRTTQKMGVAQHVYVVGGAVRNFLIDQPIKDIDIVVDSLSLRGNRDAEWVAEGIARAIPTRTKIWSDNLMVSHINIEGSWNLNGYEMEGNDIEIVNARSEVYEQDSQGRYIGHKPKEVTPTTLEIDVTRREFTFNTLMWKLLDLAEGPDKAEIIDLTGCGIQDLRRGEMRCPQPPDLTFQQDPTRIIRTIKFAFKYGFKLPPDVRAAAIRQARGLKRIPSKTETVLKTIVLDSPQYKQALTVMDDLGVIDVLKEMMQENPQFASFLTHHSGKKGVTYMFDLMDAGLPVGASLSFLSPKQRKRFREITAPMERDHAKLFLLILKQPGKAYADKRFIPTLAQQYGFRGKKMGDFMPFVDEVARITILSDPSAANDPGRLKHLVSQSVAARMKPKQNPRGSDIAKSNGGSRILYHIGKTKPIPRPWSGHITGGPWQSHDDMVEGVWLSPNYLDVAHLHGIKGNVYAYEVPVGVIHKAGRARRFEHATEVFIPASLWTAVKFAGKKMDAATLREANRKMELERGHLSLSMREEANMTAKDRKEYRRLTREQHPASKLTRQKRRKFKGLGWGAVPRDNTKRTKSNPGKDQDIYLPEEEQLRAQRQAIYETSLSRKMGKKYPPPAGSDVGGWTIPKAFRDTRGKRLDAKIIRKEGPDQLRPYMQRRMFAMGTGVQQRDSRLKKGTQTPTAKAIRESKARYSDVDKLVRNRQDYEESLAIARKSSFYRITKEPTKRGWEYFVWPLPPGERIPTAYKREGDARRRATSLERTANPLYSDKWWTPPKRKYTKRELSDWLPPAEYWRKR